LGVEGNEEYEGRSGAIDERGGDERREEKRADVQCL
jgi:hypothetical protein